MELQLSGKRGGEGERGEVRVGEERGERGRGKSGRGEGGEGEREEGEKREGERGVEGIKSLGMKLFVHKPTEMKLTWECVAHLVLFQQLFSLLEVRLVFLISF